MEKEEYVEHVKKRLRGSVIMNKNGCWIWQKQLHYHYPYGITTFTENGRKSKQPAHRVSYKVFVGKIPKGLYILHQCDEPRCINPDHLHAGTQKQNMKEMRERNRANDKSRGKKGSKHGMSKLTEEDIPKIKELYKSGMSGTKIAKIYGVNNTMIYFILNGKNWTHVKEDEFDKD